MTAIHIVSLVLTSCCLALCDVVTTEEATKADNFVSFLKLNLRRNNDDYVETVTGSFSVSNPYLASHSTSLSTVKPETARNSTEPAETARTPLGPDTFSYRRDAPHSNTLPAENQTVQSHRRKFGSRLSRKNAVKNETIDIYSTAQPMPVTTETVTLSTVSPKPSGNILNKLRQRPKEPVGLRFRSERAEMTEDVKRDKVDKFKKFLTKNKSLFSEFVAKKRAEAAAKQAQLAKEMEAQQEMRAKLVKEATMANEPVQVMRVIDVTVEPQTTPAPATTTTVTTTLPPPAALARGGYMSGDQELARFRAEAHVPLTADQLDMAPARGGKIHSLRIKGRLCQRNVLIPEGPKYDRSGSMYLPAYAHARARNFSRTLAPRLLLPRCCNCCKKSLLGCE